ncbi:MAG: four-carbon acid sugar kinase family protein [Candidatus Poribacteria bacterium]|nr:four-carbon acid sugar kinase family protein [Candidatus Poribacteria bacterium]
MNRRYGIIADDLTGACDTGAAFVQSGMTTYVSVNDDANEALCADAEVVVVPTFSRDESPSVAERKVVAAVKRLIANGIDVLYKKIDSTLLGNLAVEVEAARVSGGFPFALIAPSFPEQGRTVRDGWLHLERDGVSTRTEKHLPTLLHKASDGSVAHIELEPSGTDSAELSVAIRQAFERGATRISVDGATRADLQRIASVGLHILPRPLFVGSAALAGEIASILTQQGYRQSSSTQPGKSEL